MFGTVADVRFPLLIIAGVICSAGSAFAQEQERTLVNRLLEPDMTLGNPAQSKHFESGSDSTTARSAHVKEFYTKQSAQPKEFAAQRSFLARVFGTRLFHHSRANADLTTRADVAATLKQLSPKQSYEPHASYDQHRLVATREYATRADLERGKSQKSLDQQNAPLTIDQVRDLLNKNK